MVDRVRSVAFKSWNRNHNFSKVRTGTGTVINSYGSTTLVAFTSKKLQYSRILFYFTYMLVECT
jgi:hypothetical protein